MVVDRWEVGRIVIFTVSLYIYDVIYINYLWALDELRYTPSSDTTEDASVSDISNDIPASNRLCTHSY